MPSLWRPAVPILERSLTGGQARPTQIEGRAKPMVVPLFILRPGEWDLFYTPTTGERVESSRVGRCQCTFDHTIGVHLPVQSWVPEEGAESRNWSEKWYQLEPKRAISRESQRAFEFIFDICATGIRALKGPSITLSNKTGSQGGPSPRGQWKASNLLYTVFPDNHVSTGAPPMLLPLRPHPFPAKFWSRMSTQLLPQIHPRSSECQQCPACWTPVFHRSPTSSLLTLCERNQVPLSRKSFKRILLPTNRARETFSNHKRSKTRPAFSFNPPILIALWYVDLEDRDGNVGIGWGISGQSCATLLGFIAHQY